MKKIVIENGTVKFIGFEQSKQIYLVIRNSGIEISDKPISTILPVIIVRIDRGRVKSESLSEKLISLGCKEENTLTFNGEDYSLLTKKEA